ECVEALQELVEGPVAADELSPVENTGAETAKAELMTVPPAKRKGRAVPEETDGIISGATANKNAKGTKTSRKNKFQGPKNTTTAKRSRKTKQTSYGKRRKKKARKSLFGEREMASKKPLLSPIPEIPEVLSSVSSPDSPKANTLCSEDEVLDHPKSRNACKDVQQELEVVERIRGKNSCAVDVYPSSEDLHMEEASSSRDGILQVSEGDLESGAGTDHKFSTIVPDAKDGFDTPECFQQGEEAACEKEAKESDSLIESEKFQGNLLSGLESLAQEATGSSYNVEEVLSVPQPRGGSSHSLRRKSSTSGEVRVRRSMRLSRDTGSEGLAWILLPSEIPRQPPLPASAPRTRRTISTSILTGSAPHREQNLLFAAPGKENEDSVPAAAGHCRRGRRSSICTATARETASWAPTQKRRISNSVYRKDRSNQKLSEEVKIPLELTFSKASVPSHFLK
ncbi:PREDICTED: cell division cycle-associated protein 2, partial [Acanthisitta chloris]|uniref:cell division cycle-associated protein 2 n=1 Tax=Acanthisitta chloris TaxID=57068 RepID=UPI0004F0DC6A